MGRFASGAVVAKSGDTMVYSTACCDNRKVDAPFLPLRVDYYSRFRFYCVSAQLML